MYPTPYNFLKVIYFQIAHWHSENVKTSLATVLPQFEHEIANMNSAALVVRCQNIKIPRDFICFVFVSLICAE